MTKRKLPEDLLPMGRPTDYTPELGEYICDLLAASPDGLKRMCALNKDIPGHTTIKKWRNKYPDFMALYLKAKELQGLEIIDSLRDEADALPAVSEEINRFNARFRFYQFHLAKLSPKQFGDKAKADPNITVNIHEDRLKHLK